jgi:cytochrome c
MGMAVGMFPKLCCRILRWMLPLSALAAAEPRVLVFSKVEAGQYVHESIPDGERAIAKLGKENGFGVDATADASIFKSANLARYGAIVFNNTGGEVLDSLQRAAFQAFIRAGGGYVGFHSACGTEYQWPWYGAMIGNAWFKQHPGMKDAYPGIQKAKVLIADNGHLSTRGLPAVWERTDEWHDYRANPRALVHVLLTLDEKSYLGGTMGADHPIAWCRDYEGGRAWFTGLGHTKESFTEPLFLAHLLGGIRYALGGMDPAGIPIMMARNGKLGKAMERKHGALRPEGVVPYAFGGGLEPRFNILGAMGATEGSRFPAIGWETKR